ncbi:hypothetical protein CERZMDRAFT_103207 [Cercospora zeae-maydis SCOH1-5]|uniref:Uncharacterized protein n=1 Tax=Cercospora zeae-maydis SCOH1-5 TaxID=717836 RepID=A0A6A6F1Y0_9PEZI|nr:hypothetical protein CERZMDRAFT_103207 [Cercospora zeae-maydis SCOH1-5]
MSRETSPDQRQPRPRQWLIARIVDKRYTDQGVIELQADWQPTTVRASQVSTDEDNTLWVHLEGERMQGVRRRVRVGVDGGSGEALWSIEWKPTWRSVWGLTGAMDAVAAYHESHLENVRRKEGTWWRVSDLGPLVQRAEGAPAPEAPLTLVDAHYLVPERGVDYTLAIAAHFFGALDGLASKASVRYLNMPVRQRLVFADAYVESLASGRKKGVNLRSHLRLMLVYATGLARRVDMCTRCEEGRGPFPKCVIDDSAAAGTCVNCAMSVSDTSRCQWWHHNRRGERPSLWNPALVHDAGPDGAGGAAHDSREASGGAFMTPGTDGGGDGDLAGGGTPARSRSSTVGRNDRSSAYGTPESAPLEVERRSREGAAAQSTCERPGTGECAMRGRGLVRTDGHLLRFEPRTPPSEALPRPSKRRRRDTQAERPPRIGEHRTCTSARFGRPCRDEVVGAWQVPRDAPVRVERDRIFAYGEASEHDVNDVLRCCPCDQTEEFEAMYRVYVESQGTELRDDRVLRKGECLSKVWYAELNHAVRLYCPARGQPRPDAPECIELD